MARTDPYPLIESVPPAGSGPLGFEELAALYGRPATTGSWIRANAVSSLDGSAAGSDALSGSLSSASDRAVFAVLRALCDVVVVGAGTLRAEGYRGELVDRTQRAWRSRQGLAPHPEIVIVTRSVELDPAVLRSFPVRPVILAPEGPPVAAERRLSEVADLVRAEADVDAAALRRLLRARGLRHALCEGGPRLLGDLSGAEGIDELCLTVSPLLVAGSASRIAHGPSVTTRMRLAHVLRGEDGDLHLRYVRATQA